MRDRLIELIVDAENAIYCEKPYCTDTERIGKVADHLLAEGVIVPFAKCGTEIWGAFEWYPEEACDGVLSGYSLQADGVWFHCHYSNGLTMWHKIEDFGKTVFRTRSEAEQALAERRGE